MNLFRSKNDNFTNHKFSERALLLIPLVLVCFALLPTVQAVTPAPDGGYAGFNTAEGQSALFSRTTGAQDTALGAFSLFADTTGNFNTAVGTNALRFNTTGSSNTASGVASLFHNTTGIDNTAIGVNALFSNTIGVYNAAYGNGALFNNTEGFFNTATGFQTLVRNTVGSYNTANGSQALFYNTTGLDNTAVGFQALGHNTTGGANTASGNDALLFNTTGGSNTALGFAAGSNLTTGSNNIDIGQGVFGVAGESNTIRIGNVGTQTATYIAGISQATVAKGLAVVVDPTGHLGTKGSSERFKDAIKPMDKASEAILALKPVTFHYKKELDPEGIPQFGLVAEEVEKVNSDLVAYDAEGKVYTVRYEAVNAMLLNEFLKEHRKVEELKKDFESKLAEQQKQIKALTSGLEKVSAQLETSKPAPQMVLNNP